MSFKQSIEIEKIQNIVNNINEQLESIEEYGHVSIPSDEHFKLKERSEKIVNLLNACSIELDNFTNEITDWYSY
jgi:hypothetical protein